MIRAARIISFIGHPLITTSAFLLFLGRRHSAISLQASLLVIAVVVIPLALWNLRNSRAGTYSNFDVSVRTERHSMYGVTVALMVLAALVLYLANVAFPLRAGMTGILAMFAVAAVANHWIKLSLHAAVSCYLAVGMMAIDVRAGVVLLGCSLVVALSRLVLHRHSLLELTGGAGLGLAAGAALLIWI